MTTEQLMKFCPAAVRYENGIRQATGVYKINTPLRLCHFLAQTSHESAGWTHFTENLNYSADRLLQVFPKYFPNMNFAKQYERKPEKIANRVYGGRLGNGPEESGDGWKYRGRGCIQITGKDNYRTCGVKNAVDNPDLLLDPLNACLSAGHFWDAHGINQWADKDNLEKVTRLINGGTIGIADRLQWLNRAKDIFL